MRSVTVTHTFKVEDDATDEQIHTIVGTMTVQVEEPVVGYSDDLALNELTIDTSDIEVTTGIIDTRTVWVVSWVYWNGDEQGGGGFVWFWNEGTATQYFEQEKTAWRGGTARVRMVKVDVPADLFGEIDTKDSEANTKVTAFLDHMIDDLENYLPALKVALVCDERNNA